jgi:hypothetical protein
MMPTQHLRAWGERLKVRGGFLRNNRSVFPVELVGMLQSQAGNQGGHAHVPDLDHDRLHMGRGQRATTMNLRRPGVFAFLDELSGAQTINFARAVGRLGPMTPLGRDAIAELLADLLGKDASLAGLAGPIHARTGGNLQKLEIPATVQAVLTARIDRLADRETGRYVSGCVVRSFASCSSPATMVDAGLICS